MGFEDKYEEQTWTCIRRLPFLIAIAMEGAGRSGIGGSASERMAMAESLAAGPRDFPENALISAIIPKLENGKDVLTYASGSHDEIMDCLTTAGVEDRKGLLAHIYNMIPGVLSDLRAQENQLTLHEYKKWILNTALAVAKAGKEGDFLGFGGEWFSEEERAIYSRLQELFN